LRLTSIAISACAFVLLLGIIIISIIWLLLPGWWKRKYVRLSVISIPIATALSIAAWALGHRHNLPFLTDLGSHLTPTLLILEFTLALSLPLSGLVYSAGRILDRVKPADGRRIAFSPRRRRLFKGLAIAFPAVAVPSGMTGVAESYSSISVPIRGIPVTNLPSALEGFKIAHLSDLHLGYYVHLDTLRGAVDNITPNKPDLVLVTGDIADDLSLLPEALKIINQLTPRYGIYASVGNHEYYRGITEVLSIFNTGPFPILINDHRLIPVGGASIFLGGADDPKSLRKDHSEFLIDTIDRTMEQVPDNAFRLLMCHRPEGFNHSAEKGIDLILSGHTHGGQIGFAGRSLLEPIFPEKYLWGIYRRGKTTLFTSGGMGHWIPFRLGVPAEAPILVLHKG
jgi:uncharacterized protein